MRTRILLVEDHQAVRQGLRGLIERSDDFEVIAETPDGASAVELAVRLRPEIVVMDLRLSRLSGLEATRRIVDQCPGCQVLVLSQHHSRSVVQQALDAGAAGYVVKTSSVSQLLVAARAIRDGRSYLSPELGPVGR